MQRMTRLEYRLGFATPAFLGGADQGAQWRTPPFKALLRQWWRVLNAKKFHYRHEQLREREGSLFGNAWLDGDGQGSAHRKSDVRLRLTPDSELRPLDSSRWPKGFKRVKTAPRASVPADLYLGYGPVEAPSKKENRPDITIRRGGAIPPGIFATFSMIVPQEERRALEQVLLLVAWFGAAGSRSRNGWGSIVLQADGEAAEIPTLGGADLLPSDAIRPWQQCLDLEWPHAVGLDEAGLPLVWFTAELENWQRAIEELAQIKVRIRAAAKQIRSGNVGALHYLGYPAGTGRDNPWELNLERGQEGRLASQLRFKVIPASGDKVRGLVVHVPCGVPRSFLDLLAQDRDRLWLESLENQLRAWAAIHDILRRDRGLTQLGAEA